MQKFILIGGLPRSGTTLLETILGSHSKIAMPPGDFHFAEQYTKGLSVNEIFQNLSKEGTWNHWHVKDFSFLYDKSHAVAFRESMRVYAEGIEKDIPAAKAPYSEFFFATYQDWLLGTDLKFLHMVRNPFDAIASFKHSHLHSEARIYGDAIEIQAKNWLRSATMGLARKFADPNHYEVIQYEKLAEDPLSCTKAICIFLDVEFDEKRMMNRVDYDYHNTNTSFTSNIPNVEKGRHIYAAESRKKYLDPSESEMICAICGETARAMGYNDPDFIFQPRHYVKRMKKSKKFKNKLKRTFSTYFNET